MIYQYHEQSSFSVNAMYALDRKEFFNFFKKILKEKMLIEIPSHFFATPLVKLQD